MAVTNPAFSKNKAFSPNATPEELQALYDMPSANAVQEQAMTYENTITKTFISFVVLILGAAGGWILAQNNPALAMPIVTIGAIGGFILAMVNSFKREPSPVLILLYALLEGALLGAISLVFEAQYQGIVFQAVLATLAVVGVTLALFANGKIRASKRATKIFMIAIFSYLGYLLLSFILQITGVIQSQWGLSGVEIMGIPLGMIIGPLVILLGAYSLVLDFDFIQRGVNNKAPEKYGWTGAFGIMVSVVFLYLQILQFLAQARD